MSDDSSSTSDSDVSPDKADVTRSIKRKKKINKRKLPKVESDNDDNDSVSPATEDSHTAVGQSSSKNGILLSSKVGYVYYLECEVFDQYLLFVQHGGS